MSNIVLNWLDTGTEPTELCAYRSGGLPIFVPALPRLACTPTMLAQSP